MTAPRVARAAALPAARRGWLAAVRDVDAALRLHFVFFSVLLPVLAAATAVPALTAVAIARLVAAGLCLHLFAYLLNDVVDLPIDRGQPLRQGHPLVRGALSPRPVLTIALAAAPAGAALTAAGGGGPAALAVQALGFAAMAAYNVYGKRAAVPLATDAVQAVAWGSLAPYGALAAGGSPNALTWMVAAHAALFIGVINGVNGGLRDLANDLASGARTTAIALGARPRPGGGVAAPAALWAFTLSGTAAIVALDWVAAGSMALGYDGATRRWTRAAIAALGAAAIAAAAAMLRGRGPRWRRALRLHLFALLLPLPAAFAAFVAPPVRTTLAAALAASIAALLVANGGALVPPGDGAADPPRGPVEDPVAGGTVDPHPARRR